MPEQSSSQGLECRSSKNCPLFPFCQAMLSFAGTTVDDLKENTTKLTEVQQLQKELLKQLPEHLPSLKYDQECLIKSFGPRKNLLLFEAQILSVLNDRYPKRETPDYLIKPRRKSKNHLV